MNVKIIVLVILAVLMVASVAYAQTTLEGLSDFLKILQAGKGDAGQPTQPDVTSGQACKVPQDKQGTCLTKEVCAAKPGYTSLTGQVCGGDYCCGSGSLYCCIPQASQTNPSKPYITQINGVPVPYEGGKVKITDEKITFDPATQNTLEVKYVPIDNVKRATLELWILDPASEAPGFTGWKKERKDEIRKERQFILVPAAQSPAGGTFSVTLSSLPGLVEFYNKWKTTYSGKGLYLVVENSPIAEGYDWKDTPPVRLNWADSCANCNSVLHCMACIGRKFVAQAFAGDQYAWNFEYVKEEAGTAQQPSGAGAEPGVGAQPSAETQQRASALAKAESAAAGQPCRGTLSKYVCTTQSDCTKRGGSWVAGYCPGSGANIKCCVTDAADVPAAAAKTTPPPTDRAENQTCSGILEQITGSKGVFEIADSDFSEDTSPCVLTVKSNLNSLTLTDVKNLTVNFSPDTGISGNLYVLGSSKVVVAPNSILGNIYFWGNNSNITVCLRDRLSGIIDIEPSFYSAVCVAGGGVYGDLYSWTKDYRGNCNECSWP